MRGLAAWGAVLAFLGAGLAAEPPGPVSGGHGKLPCAECHVEGAIKDCGACHAPAENPHPIRVSAWMPVPPGTPLDEEGRLLCRSCHRVHGGRPEVSYLREANVYCEDSRRAFCTGCHGRGMAGFNPHLGRSGEARCPFCHAAAPAGAEEARKNMRADVAKLCRFCHGVEVKDHVQDLDLSAPIPKGVPVGPGGSWTCATCHDPHGATTATRHLRPDFALRFGRMKGESPHLASYFACRACHTSSFAEEIRPPDFRLYFRGDRNQVCLSCHLLERGHHPTGIHLPKAFGERLASASPGLPLDARGRITCSTCHDTGCSTGRQQMNLRRFDRTTKRTELCWLCHDRAEFARNDPHVDDSSQCRWCHTATPVAGGNGKTALLTDATLVCLLCHEVGPHPSGADHLTIPPARLRPSESLPLGPRDEITCATCHEPHLQPIPLPRRLRTHQRSLCGLCHLPR